MLEDSDEDDHDEDDESMGRNGDQLQYNEMSSIEAMNDLFQRGYITPDRFVEAQENDITINTSKRAYTAVNGIKCIKSRLPSGSKLLPVIPQMLLRAYATSLHYSREYFHQSPDQILRKIRLEFYVLNDVAVKAELNSCYWCQISSPQMTRKHLFQLNVLPSQPRQVLGFDVVGSLASSNEYRYIYLCVDIFSGWTIAAAAKSKRIEEVIDFLINLF